MTHVSDPAADHWDLDKRIPIAIVAAIVVQTASIMFWVGSIDTRVAMLEGSQAANQDVRERVIRMEEQLKHIAFGVDQLTLERNSK